MRAFTTLLTYPVIALAAAIAPRDGPVPDEPWTAGVWRQPTTDDVFFVGDAINASGGKFWVNKNTTAYCPTDNGVDCSAYNGSRTVFAGGIDTLSLAVLAPSGQQVYIAVDGSLSYTTEHSAGLPDGAVATGFTRTQSESFGAPLVLGHSGDSWLICPVSDGEPRERTYQLYVGHSDKEGCLSTGIRTYTSSVDAYAYL
ncbi:hypothetical protein GGR54DRAFT_94562 [Hypoxylon sp. NC1633]|nr:hypothetical protein GGR54DRAFT_94562 [Hypoxylon sp. NC1633]